MPYKDEVKQCEYMKLWMREHRKRIAFLYPKIPHIRMSKEEIRASWLRKYYRNSAKVAEQRRTIRESLHRETIDIYGHYCALCAEKDYGKLTIDHMYGDGKDFRKPFHQRGQRMSGHHFYRWLKARGFPKDLGLRVLCKSCNSRMRWAR